MSSSYTCHHVHIVFGTKNRAGAIPEKIQPKLWAYMAGIAKNHGMHAVAVGGMDDHVHLLIELGGALGISKAVQVIKANSSRWMNEHPGPRFEWQDGYFACSVSRSLVARVAKYIQNQKQHHKKMDFATEFSLLLKKHGLEPRD